MLRPEVASLVTAGLLTIFRLAYFGFPLPNTFYAKVSPSLVYRLAEGSRYLMLYVMSSPIVFVCSLGGICLGCPPGERSIHGCPHSRVDGRCRHRPSRSGADGR